MPRRILLFVTDLEIGGTPTVVRELAVRLRESAAHAGDATHRQRDPFDTRLREGAARAGDATHADDVTYTHVVSLKGPGANGPLLAERGIPVTALHARSPFNLPGVAWRLRRLIRDQRIDTVVSFLVHANAVAALAVPRDVRLFQSIQTTQRTPAWHWRVQRWAARRAHRVIVPSTSVVAAGVARSSIPLEKFIVIPNAVDADAFERSRVPQAPPEPYPIGFIGRLDAVKRVPDLINAVATLSRRVALHVYGDGPQRSRIERWIEAASAASITLHGSIPRPQDALQSLGLLVLPSEAEGFGLVLIEAMAAGVPVVATDAPGIRDVVRHESNGLLVPVGDPASLAHAIARVLDDPDLRRRLIENGLADVRERFVWDVVHPQYERLLEL